MIVQIFDVEHGGCALITTSNNRHILVDCGHNSTTGWRPSEYLLDQGIHALDMLVVTNYDEDHVSDLPNLLDRVSISSLLRNRSVSPNQITALKTEDGMGRGIGALVDMANSYAHPAAPIDFGDVSIEAFCNAPYQFDDENNLSLLVFFRGSGMNIIFPGDMEKAGWRAILQQPEVWESLKNVNVLVASHHGRESGCCEDVFTAAGGPCSPTVCVMSDMATIYDTQKMVPWYRARSKGLLYNGKRRHVFTTRRDGRIMFWAHPNGDNGIHTTK